MIRVAKLWGADVIHPGYGLLSENPEFAETCAEAGITFIGPSPETMRRLGNKTARAADDAAREQVDHHGQTGKTLLGPEWSKKRCCASPPRTVRTFQRIRLSIQFWPMAIATS